MVGGSPESNCVSGDRAPTTPSPSGRSSYLKIDVSSRPLISVAMMADTPAPSRFTNVDVMEETHRRFVGWPRRKLHCETLSSMSLRFQTSILILFCALSMILTLSVVGRTKPARSPAGEAALRSVRLDLNVSIVCCVVFLLAAILYTTAICIQIWKRRVWLEEQMLTVVFMVSVWALPSINPVVLGFEYRLVRQLEHARRIRAILAAVAIRCHIQLVIHQGDLLRYSLLA